MAEFLGMAIHQEDDIRYSRGDIVECRANDGAYGGMETLPMFFILKVPELLLSECVGYDKSWDLQLGYEVIARDTIQDGYRLRIYSELTSVSDLGALKIAQLPSRLSDWAHTVVKSDPNDIRVDLKIYDMMMSKGFWDVDLTGVSHEQISYDQVSGAYRVRIDYSMGALNSSTAIERYVMTMGGTVISHAGQVIVFDMNRSTVLDKFKREVKDDANKMLYRRRYYFSKGVVDYIVAQGGIVTATKAEFLTYLKDKLDE